MVEFNSRLFFAAQDGTTGNELWSTDGTAAGTALVADANPGSGGSAPNKLCVFNNKIFYSAEVSNGRELWSSDGTAAGTAEFMDIKQGAASKTV